MVRFDNDHQEPHFVVRLHSSAPEVPAFCIESVRSHLERRDKEEPIRSVAEEDDADDRDECYPSRSFDWHTQQSGHKGPGPRNTQGSVSGSAGAGALPDGLPAAAFSASHNRATIVRSTKYDAHREMMRPP